jgi:DNA-binding NarL/FixJ family response regulator
VPIKVLLVDDSDTFLTAAAHFLARESGIEVVGRAAGGAEAVALVPALRPDVVLMDLSMPGLGGFEATRQIKAMKKAPRVVILTLRDTPRDRAAASTMADGFVSKAELGRELVPTIARLFGAHHQWRH